MSSIAELLISRRIASEELWRVRYEASEVSQQTLWRWCDLAGIPTGLEEFTPTQFEKLRIVAIGLREGKSKPEILEDLISYESFRSA
ncbi:MAG TPA: hypothetical protein V6C65_33375 [Allocoleopsis sp.]